VAAADLTEDVDDRRAEHRVAVELAGAAGDLLMELRSRSTQSGRDLSDQGDALSHEFLMAELAARCPGDEVRSEEGAEAPGAERLWIIDPLDGSREFGDDRDDWAVHVALAVGGHPVVGAVALPALDVVIGTLTPPPLPAPAPVPRLVVSRSRPPAVAERVADRLGASTIAMGSAGAKIAAVIRGQADIYVHAGGQYEWDSAAPVAVALVTGLHASRIDGSSLRYGLSDPWLPDLLVCHPTLADATLAALSEPG
jgi:3'(2'), 5'-bisphosphate nucleotidase